MQLLKARAEDRFGLEVVFYYTGDKSVYNQKVEFRAGSRFAKTFHVVENIRKLPKVGMTPTAFFNQAMEATSRQFEQTDFASRSEIGGGARKVASVSTILNASGKENTSILAQKAHPPSVPSPLKPTQFAALKISSSETNKENSVISRNGIGSGGGASISFGSSIFDDDDF